MSLTWKAGALMVACGFHVVGLRWKQVVMKSGSYGLIHLVFESTILIPIDLCYYLPNIVNKKIKQTFHIRRREKRWA
jgi:hypothetical protein